MTRTIKGRNLRKWKCRATMTEKRKNLLIRKSHVTVTNKGRNLLRWKCRSTMTEKGKNLLIWKCHLTIAKKVAHKSNELQLLNHSLSFNVRNCSLLSATSFLSRSPMAYNSTASLDKLTCTNYVDFGKCQDKFGQISWSKNDSNYSDVKPKFSKKMTTNSAEWSKILKGRGRFQPVYAIEESTGHCSRKTC